MKSEQEITTMANEMKDNLVNAGGENVLLIQGFLRGLNWVTAEEKEE